MVERLDRPAPDEADWLAALAALHELHALERSCGAEFSAQVWNAYVAGLAIASNTGGAKGYLPEDPLPLLLRLALDARTQSSFELRSQVEISLGVALRNAGRMHEARMRTLAALHFADSTVQWRASSWIELARDQTQLGEWSEASAALTCAETELDALAAQALERRDWTQLSFDLACARARLEVVLGRPDAAAAALSRARELEGSIADDFTRHQLLACEVDLAYASDNDELLIERLEEHARAGPLAPEHLERLAFSYLDSRADDPRAQERAEQLLRQLASDALAPGALRASAELGLGLLHRRRGEWEASALALARAAPQAGDALEFELAAQLAALAVARGERGSALAPELARLRRNYERALAHWRSAPIPPDGLGVMNYRERRGLLSELIGLEQLADAVHGPARALQHVLDAEALGSLARERGAPPAQVERARRLLCAPARGLLVYVPGPERGFVFALDLSGVELHELEGSPRWNKAQRDLWRLLAQPPQREGGALQRLDDYRALIERLSQALLPARLRTRLGSWREVTIVGADLLGYVPFECLRCDGRELGQEWALCYAPSVLLASELAERPLGAPRSGLRLVAAPLEASDAPAQARRKTIVWDGSREQRLRELWRDNLRVSSGRDATYSALVEDGGADLAVLEILAHGHYDSQHSPPAAIALAPGALHTGRTYTPQIARLRCPPIVALAVCGAARGPLRGGDAETGHLGGALLRAGARVALLATLDIEQAATEALLDATYRELTRDGVSTAEALRRARRQLADDPQFADPYYRNLLHCHGQGHETLVAAQAHSPSWEHANGPALAAAALAATGALALWVARRPTRPSA